METNYNINGNVNKWKGELVSETSFSRTSIGVYDNVMEFFPSQGNKNNGFIEWTYSNELNEADVVEIGLGFEGKKVVDYDGVFELPEPAVKLLESLGFDCSEVV
jgi:hypothetical protein